ncbi:response regulator transcription factor [Mesorhizobium sp.]|uniref:response regulator transcription factor n=1 Tax=Mesorhizobium sp. TaxID=1871066 RepID=UPI000FE47FF8|nr:response regulator transcription factor [Mesorhizobium sp.]RWI16558.1 MAG: response regulator transcription factor [Mesorhizobium sp.]RWN07627.1 MAG: response regulator transcription factor [Mesorhizobium sp.]RWN12454.1 MAG: response regulator transcription factor [Mesorhizobium sp.]TIQ97674.1 MAG: response regulator transcription factor [Mesorhizobium sp.]
MKPVVLICSEDAEFYLIFGHILGEAGFGSLLAGKGEEAIRLAHERELQAVILDCQPGRAAWSATCARLKGDPRSRPLPVVALIAPGAESQHLDLLKTGVDDSFVRPFAPAKLLARLQARLHGAPGRATDFLDGEELICGELEIRPASNRVRYAGHQLRLGTIEFKLLRQLITSRGTVSSRDDLIRAAWPANTDVDARTVDVHISRLRKALKTVSSRKVIRTIRSAGYSLVEHD